VTLYRPEAFDRLTDTPWDEARVRDRIRDIVADTDAAWRGPKLFWKAHAWDGWHGTSPMKNLYVGTAGVLWGLDQLRQRGHAETTLGIADLALRNLELFRSRPDYLKVAAYPPPEPPDSSLFLGEAGILLVAWRLAPSDGLADDLHARVRENVNNPAEEIFFGAPGSLIAAHAMYRWTDEERWRSAWDELAEALLARRGEDGFWTQRLYRQEFTSLTPGHGLVGNVRALSTMLDEERTAELKRTSAAILARTAHREDGIANWPPRRRPELCGPDGEIRVQWCAGSPGVVAAAADYLDEDLLLAGAELPWQAGPHGDEKGPNICHGTAGNGYAFLKAFERTGDERWLERARRFAMHALEQVERMPRRYSLFTGGIGVALYAADCVDAHTRYPITDYV
jgi:Lanthionine synthetase C-like protein